MKKISIILLVILLISSVSKSEFISDKIQETILKDLKKIDKFTTRLFQQNSEGSQQQNNRPIIGILTEPPLDEFTYQLPYTYMAASYVKYIEGGGAQVAPVQYDLDEQSLINIMGQLNGILIPGGDVDILNPNNSLTTWGKTVQTIANYSITQFNQGIIFPVWATCLGFQSVITVMGEEDILVFVNHTNSSSNLVLLETNLDNNFFAVYPADLLNVIETQAPFFFNHNYGIQQAAFMANSKLTNLFEITSLASNYHGTQFIASIQGKNGLPIFGSQFHPEKNAYEWNKTLSINHGSQAVEISQYLQDFFINQARNNFNKFNTQANEDNALIYNFQETPTPTSSFTSAYFFSKNLLNEDMSYTSASPSLSSSNLNLQPIIGVITEPSSYSSYPSSQYGELSSSYVKFLESAGARVVPILFDSDNDTISFMFSRINGLLFPGGATDLFTNTVPMQYSTYAQTVKTLLNLAFQANKNGDYFPVWAICLGFETTLVTMGQDYNNSLLQYLDDINRTENITLVSQSNSMLFANLPVKLYQYMTTSAPMYFDHYWGITVDKFNQNSYLTELFTISSVAYTVNGTEFVGSIEAKNNYPIIASQFHPEKPPNEWWSYLNINHSPESIEITQYLANTFVGFARNNHHAFDSQTQLNQYMIWNYCAIMETSGSYMTVYFPLNANQQNIMI